MLGVIVGHSGGCGVMVVMMVVEIMYRVCSHGGVNSWWYLKIFGGGGIWW